MLLCFRRLGIYSATLTATMDKVFILILGSVTTEEGVPQEGNNPTPLHLPSHYNIPVILRTPRHQKCSLHLTPTQKNYSKWRSCRFPLFLRADFL
ncbi:hypothetical protein AVEN_76408-1 [Araneus ventricosus]|uniref:Uncharacterized protein n=1 Tax=Araneus ventricosus TaxID=182803 RepID=A0A4Y2SCH0_ARAVE|nr:hypothetical protein AVEN_76408-1 [Araneus ventricosus]